MAVKNGFIPIVQNLPWLSTKVKNNVYTPSLGTAQTAQKYPFLTYQTMISKKLFPLKLPLKILSKIPPILVHFVLAAQFVHGK